MNLFIKQNQIHRHSKKKKLLVTKDGRNKLGISRYTLLYIK